MTWVVDLSCLVPAASRPDPHIGAHGTAEGPERFGRKADLAMRRGGAGGLTTVALRPRLSPGVPFSRMDH